LLFDRLQLRRPRGLTLKVWAPRIRLRLRRFDRQRNFDGCWALYAGLDIFRERMLWQENLRQVVPAQNNLWRQGVRGRYCANGAQTNSGNLAYAPESMG
jgi:hypothetical protein